MEHDATEPATPGSDAPAKKTRRVGRRTAIKAGIAATSGLLLSATYQGPTITSAHVEENYTVSGRVPTEDPEQPGRGHGYGHNKKKKSQTQ